MTCSSIVFFWIKVRVALKMPLAHLSIEPRCKNEGGCFTFLLRIKIHHTCHEYIFIMQLLFLSRTSISSENVFWLIANLPQTWTAKSLIRRRKDRGRYTTSKFRVAKSFYTEQIFQTKSYPYRHCVFFRKKMRKDMQKICIAQIFLQKNANNFKNISEH